MIIAVDFDGTIVKHEYPRIGEECPNAFRVLKRLGAHKLILYTMRSGLQLEEAVAFCKEQGLEFWSVNENPEQYSWTDSRKVYAHMYIDDTALGCPVVKGVGERPYVDWWAIEKLLVERNILFATGRGDGLA